MIFDLRKRGSRRSHSREVSHSARREASAPFPACTGLRPRGPWRLKSDPSRKSQPEETRAAASVNLPCLLPGRLTVKARRQRWAGPCPPGRPAESARGRGHIREPAARPAATASSWKCLEIASVGGMCHGLFLRNDEGDGCSAGKGTAVHSVTALSPGGTGSGGWSPGAVPRGPVGSASFPALGSVFRKVLKQRLKTS